MRVFEDETVYTVAEIVERLKVHPDTVRDWLRTGDLRGVNFGGRTGWRAQGKDLNAFVAGRGQPAVEHGHEREG